MEPLKNKQGELVYNWIKNLSACIIYFFINFIFGEAVDDYWLIIMINFMFEYKVTVYLQMKSVFCQENESAAYLEGQIDCRMCPGPDVHQCM